MGRQRRIPWLEIVEIAGDNAIGRHFHPQPVLRYSENMAVDDLRIEDQRSWYLNRAAIDHARADWSHARKILTFNLDRMERRQTVAPKYIARCRELMDQGIDEMASVFLAFTDEGQVLRSVHPWAGLLPQSERLEILRATRRAYD